MLQSRPRPAALTAGRRPGAPDRNSEALYLTRGRLEAALSALGPACRGVRNNATLLARAGSVNAFRCALGSSRSRASSAVCGRRGLRVQGAPTVAPALLDGAARLTRPLLGVSVHAPRACRKGAGRGRARRAGPNAIGLAAGGARSAVPVAQRILMFPRA